MSKKDFKKVEARLDACDNTFDAFKVVYEECPEQIRHYLDANLLELLMVELPKLQIVIQEGPTMPASEAANLAEMFSKAIAHAEEVHPKELKSMTATVKDCALELAECLDRSVKRCLIGEDKANRQASVDMLGQHAKLVRCLADIALTPDQLKQVEEFERDAD